jgi:hypothetical protein
MKGMRQRYLPYFKFVNGETLTDRFLFTSSGNISKANADCDEFNECLDKWGIGPCVFMKELFTRKSNLPEIFDFLERLFSSPEAYLFSIGHAVSKFQLKAG